MADRIRSAVWSGGLAVAVAAVSAAAGDDSPAVDHDELDRLLRKYVVTEGVRYAAWAENDADPTALTAYVEEMAGAHPSRLPDEERLAFWINLYNAVTLRLVLDHYPVGSIRDIGGPEGSPWNRNLVTVEGRDLSLDEIENDVVRPEFQEPRIHFALNCAATSCPPLRPEAFVAERLDEQLEEQTVKFLGDPRENGVGEDGRLYLSKLFEWYGEDFVEDDRSIAAWVQPYVSGLDAGEPPDTFFRDYDWSLNEASP